MSVIVAIEEAGPSRKRLTVAVPASEVEAETDAVVRELGKTVRIPGFRRGKVPPDVVRRRFRESVEREVVDRLLPRYWRAAEEEGGLAPLAPPQVEEVGTLAAGEPFTFWFNSSAKVTKPEAKTHMRKVQSLVRNLAKKSGGRMSYFFLEGSSFDIQV